MNPLMHQMIRALRVLSMMIFALILVAGVIWWARRPSVRSLERQIEKELPHGSSRAQVVSFLIRRQIEHSDLQTDNGRLLNKRFITATIHNRYYLGIPAEERIVVGFFFDRHAQRRLLNIIILSL